MQAPSTSSPNSQVDYTSARSFHGESTCSSEDDMDWEEVNVPTASQVIQDGGGPATTLEPPLPGPSKPIEITLDARKSEPAAKKSGISHAERIVRLETHKIHTIALIANGWIRNKYLNDRLLHARLMSLTPFALQTAFSQIHKKRVPNVIRRGRLFEAAVMRLTQWWTETFFEAAPRGKGELRSRTYDDVAADLLRNRGELDGSDNEAHEVIRSCKSLQKHALLQYGSRDVSAQLFTALCRALGVPARLVVSLQSVPWQANVGKPKPSYKPKTAKGKGKQKADGNDDEEGGDMEAILSPALDLKSNVKETFPGDGQTMNGTFPIVKGKEKAKPVINLRKQRSKGRALGSRRQIPGRPLGGYPPTQWTEVFSRPDGRWLSVDPIRNFVDKPKVFEPPPHDKYNRMAYVLAFEEDGWARDVTQRYAREFTHKTSKMRVGGKGKKEWWDTVMGLLTRPYRLHRDDVEDVELQSRQILEGMPTSVAAFKDHPIYVLERHLHRNETLRPRVEIGRFRGDPVFSRENVVSGLKTAENWMRTGRVVIEGEQAMKLVKIRAVTVGRKRALGIAGEGQGVDSEGDGVMQGLYSEEQTELYRPPPVVNGKVPKNDFGNVDLYVDTMLPSGAVHIPYKGAAKIARELRFDYAEAVTGFEFKSRRAFPVVNGIVIAVENESALLQAYWESAQDAEEKEHIKREERVLKRWTRLIQGLRIRKRLQEQYSTNPSGTHGPHGVDNREDIIEPEAGGFLLETADNVVQAFTLPKPLRGHVDNQSSDGAAFDGATDSIIFDANTVAPAPSDEEEVADMDADMEEVVSDPISEPRVSVPRTMQQLAEANARELTTSLEPSLPESQKITDGDSRGTRAKRRANGDPKEAMPVRGRATRGRKRARDIDTSDSGDEEDEELAKHRKAKAAITPVPATSTRTLRTRIPKSDEKKRREREMEQAYRRAIAE